MGIGRGRAICEYIEIMQISPVRETMRLLINAPRVICNITSQSEQAFRHLFEYHPVAGGGEMIVADNVETFVPVLVGSGCGEEGRVQVDECLAASLAEVAPQRNLPAVAIALRNLLRPG